MRIDEYEIQYKNDYGFEYEMVKARQKYIKELIVNKRPSSIIEIGCGLDLLFNQVCNYDFIEKWTIVEPANIFFAEAKKSTSDTRLHIIQGYFEKVVESCNLEKVDMVICSGLLHEVKEPVLIIDAAKKILKDTGILHINVPNAFSMHRQLALEMGYINSVYDFSNRNKSLLQYHVFDIVHLQNILKNNKLNILESGGYFIKPFTHAQMEAVMKTLNSDILDGLYSLGKKYPELASEIYVNAGKTDVN